MPILVVEDDADTLELMETLLEEEGYAVACATDGSEAIKRLHEAPKPRLMILDLHMPIIDGIEVLDAMQGDELMRSVPVIVASASHRDIQRISAPNVKFKLLKPYMWDELLKAIEECRSH